MTVGWSTSIFPCSWQSGIDGCTGDVVFSVEIMVTVTVFGMWVALVVLCRGTPSPLITFSFSASTVIEGGRAPDTDEVWMEEVETGEDAIEEGEEEGEQYEDVVENDELRSTVSARSFAGFSVCSILNSDQSKVLERPSRLRSRTWLLRGSEGGAEALLQASCLWTSDLGVTGLGLGSGVACGHVSNITWAFVFSSGKDLNGQHKKRNVRWL